MLKIGITGGIACGKSTVLAEIQNQGYQVFSADEAFRDIFNTDVVQDWLLEQIELRYGVEKRKEYMEAGKTLLRYLILSDSNFKKDYETKVHPLIRQAMLDSGAQIAEVPLLFESNLENYFSIIWTVACHPETQIQRLMSRLNCNREYALVWINSQEPLNEKILKSNRVIYTDDTPEVVCKVIAQAILEDLNMK